MSNGIMYVVLNGKNKDIINVMVNGMEIRCTLVSLRSSMNEMTRVIPEHMARYDIVDIIREFSVLQWIGLLLMLG
jgi:hypothetical protein